uniref:class I SAM-dependent methyltransferase n=1 Tax=uncultured Rhizobium sp. TaxID=155567 RepID=UPI002628DC25|nr:class I SAM-dependent methyltransferase [uncultured Rhizobium sp.]
MTTALADKIKALIRQTGPISITDYFALCLADPEHGYYQTRDPFGTAGDFVTAPEVSQLFGEMIGIFLVHAWQKHLMPRRAIRIVEIGPGRGTMMKDILRVMGRLAPALYESATVHLVETSDRLSRMQAETLRNHGDKVRWHKSFEDVPDGFVLLAANEFFDAVPIRQFVKTTSGFRERMVGIDDRGDLTFAAGYGGIDPALLPVDHASQPLGTVAEVAPARSAIMQAISHRLFVGGGTALFIDYGHLRSGFGDTLQAVLDHRYDPPLAHPGRADLTSHVDFEVLAAVARASALHVNGMLDQATFLLKLGIAERAGGLGHGKDELTQQAIRAVVDRLVGTAKGEMGSLFKLLAVSSPQVALQPFEP